MKYDDQLLEQSPKKTKTRYNEVEGLCQYIIRQATLNVFNYYNIKEPTNYLLEKFNTTSKIKYILTF